MFDQYDAAYSPKDDDFEEAIIRSDILTIAEDAESAFAAIIKHKEDNPEELIEYQIQFWLGGEVIGNALIDMSVDINGLAEHKNEIIDIVRKSLH